MSNIYELLGEFNELNEMDLEPQVLADTLEAIELPIKQKAEAMVRISRNCKGTVASIDLEINRLQARKKTMQNKDANVMEWLRSSMEMTGTDKIETDLFGITLKKASKNSVLKVLDYDHVPKDYQKVSYSWDNALIKKALKDGVEIEGCELVDGKRGLLIK